MLQLIQHNKFVINIQEKKHWLYDCQTTEKSNFVTRISQTKPIAWSSIWKGKAGESNWQHHSY